MTSHHPSRDCQVLIAGAGPTGLVLACELAARGIDVRVIDRGDGVVLQTRALGVHARTLELFDMMGIADRFVDAGHRVRWFHLFTGRRTLVRLDLARNGSRFGFLLDLPQDVTESILRDRLTELGGHIEQRTELRALYQDVNGVTAFVAAAGEPQTITADYLVGADGAHSTVRHELGLDFDGHVYPQDWLLADVRLDWDRPEDEFHGFFQRHGRPLVCMPMRDHRWRVILPFAGERDHRPPTLAEIQRLVDERAPRPVPVREPTWLATFRTQRRFTDVYRRGRVLLAGDAVHVHSPAGGQGMNTGIGDAVNLGWKLALVVSGRAGCQLLDTYGQERAPAAASVLRLTHSLVALAAMSHPAHRAVRDALVPVAGRLAPVQRRAVRWLGQTAISYRGSELAVGGRRLGPRPGDRAPDVPITTPDGRDRLHALLRSGKHVLLLYDSTAALPPALRRWRDELDLATTVDGNRTRPGPRHSTLIRPDGHIAACAPLANADRLADYLRQVVAPPQNPGPATTSPPPGTATSAAASTPRTPPADRKSASTMD